MPARRLSQFWPIEFIRIRDMTSFVILSLLFGTLSQSKADHIHDVNMLIYICIADTISRFRLDWQRHHFEAVHFHLSMACPTPVKSRTSYWAPLSWLAAEVVRGLHGSLEAEAGRERT